MKAEILNNFIVSLFDASLFCHTSQVTRLCDRDWESKIPITVRKDQACNHLDLNIHNPVGPDEVHPKILRELADVAVRPLFMILENSWHSEVPGDWKKGSIALIFKNMKILGTASVSVSPLYLGRTGTVLPEAMIRHMEGREVA